MINSNAQNAPANIIVWSQTYYAHIAGGTAGTTATGLIEGAVLAVDPTDAIPMNGVLPTGAGAKNLRGVVTDNYGSTGPVEGKPINVAQIGDVGVNLAAGVGCTKGDLFVTANASGDVKPRTNETTCTIVGEALETVASQSARGRVMCKLMLQFVP